MLRERPTHLFPARPPADCAAAALRVHWAFRIPASLSSIRSARSPAEAEAPPHSAHHHLLHCRPCRRQHKSAWPPHLPATYPPCPLTFPAATIADKHQQPWSRVVAAKLARRSLSPSRPRRASRSQSRASAALSATCGSPSATALADPST
eukprot:scaffold13230_cov98-Isochrysis_galbana.AAC.3